MQRALLFLLLFVVFSCKAQTSYTISDPIDVPLEGWNKIIACKNGNTLLFHFESRRGIVVKVFDTNHKEISSKKHLCKILDINQLDEATIRGIYNVNGEADLFIEQSYRNNNSLILLRINPADGSLIEERTLLQSASFGNKTRFYVLKKRDDNYYSVFCFKNLVTHPNDTLELIRFNDKHQQIKRSTFQVDAKPYEFYYLVSANIDNTNGAVCISLLLAKKIISGINHPVYKNDLLVGYISANDTAFKYKLMQLPQDEPDTRSAMMYGQFNYNSQAAQANLVLMSQTSFFYQQGLEAGLHLNLKSLYLNLGDNSIHAKWIDNNKIADYLKSYYKDTLNQYNGVPVKMFQSDSGTSTVVYEEYKAENTVEAGRYYLRTSFGNTGIAEYDDRGHEIWGMALPKAQCLRNYMGAGEIAERGSFKHLFRGQKPDDFEKQFASIDCYNNAGSYYIFYNDFAQNATDAADSALKTVYQYNFENAFDNTNAFYYKVTPDKQVKTYFLFGMPEKGESKANFLESADYDAQTNTYITLLLHRENKATSCQIAWCKME